MRVTRRHFIRAAAVTGATVAGVGAYGTFVEPYNIGLTTYTTYSSRLPKAYNGLTIMQLADVHVGSTIDFKDLEELCGSTNILKPDFVVWNGDLTNHCGDFNDAWLNGHRVPMREIAACIKSNLDPRILSQGRSLFSPGNHENRISPDGSIDRDLETSGTIVLRNRVMPAEFHGQKLHFVGLDDDTTGKPDLNILSESIADNPVFLIAHDPGALQDVRKHEIIPQAMFSGHTHGGQMWRRMVLDYGDQVNIPGILHTLSGFPTRAVAKWFYGAIAEHNLHPHNKDNPLAVNMTYVSGGIGTSSMKARIASPPEKVLHRFHAARDDRPLVVYRHTDSEPEPVQVYPVPL